MPAMAVLLCYHTPTQQTQHKLRPIVVILFVPDSANTQSCFQSFEMYEDALHSH